MNLAVLSVAAASLLVVAKDVVSKTISGAVSPFVSSFASFLFAVPYYLFFLLISWLCGFEDFLCTGNFWIFVTLRALTDTAAESGRMFAFRQAELSSVSAVFSLHPLITLILSPLITGDVVTDKIIWGVLLATAGTYCFMKVPGKMPPKAFIITLIAAVFFSLNSCFDRISAQNASALMGAFAMNLMAGIFTLPFMLFRPGARQSVAELRDFYKPFFLRGLFEAAFMTLKLMALNTLQAPVVSVILRLNLLMQVFAGRAIFKEKGLGLRLIGSGLIIIGSVITLV